MGMINRYGLERASEAQTLLKERHRDYKGVDMDYKMKETAVYIYVCAFLKDKIVLDVE